MSASGAGWGSGSVVQDAEVDAVGGRHQVVPGVVLPERGDGHLEDVGVPGREGLRPVNAVVEPEARVLVVASLLGENRAE